MNLFVELLLAIPHQNILTEKYSVVLWDPIAKMNQTHPVNSLLAIAMLIRIYIIIRSLINFTKFASPRCERLCRHTGYQYSTLYAIKCIVHEYPLKAVFIVSFVCLLSLSFGLHVSEGLSTTPGAETVGSEFRNFSNCLWCIFITMSTVGYGDYSPTTIPGQLVAVAASMIGVILSSLLIVTLSSHLNMHPNEFKAHITLKRLKMQAII